MTSHPPPADIHLEPHDWFIATWRNLPPLPKPFIEPFDDDACLHRLRKVKILKNETWSWASAQIPTHMTQEEGLFWLTALVESCHADNPAALVAKASKWKLPQTAGLGKLLSNAKKSHPSQWASILYAALGGETLVSVFAEHHRASPYASFHLSNGILAGFREDVRPYLSDAERDTLRKALSCEINAALARKERVSFVLAGIASSIGSPELIQRLLAAPTSNLSSVYGLQYRLLAFGLPDREKIKSHMVSWQSHHIGDATESDYFRAAIAALEEEAVELLVGHLNYGSREKIESCIRDLGRIHRAGIAPTMMSLRLKQRGPAAAIAWLEEHPELALSGLIGKIEDDAIGKGIVELLRAFVRSDKRELVERHLAQIESPLADRVRQLLDTAFAARDSDENSIPDWFATETIENVSLPKWLDPATLPPILVSGQPLPSKCIPVILHALRDSTASEVRSLVTSLKKHAEPRSLDAFALAVFERWLEASGSAKEWWALRSLGLIGGDRACLRLQQLIHVWPAQSFSQRADVGLECLRQIGSPQALASLYAIGTAKARDVLKEIASERNFTFEQLEDLAVPSLGLEHEQATIDLGRRRFRLGLSPDLEACLIDARHERCFALPELRDDDEPAKVDLARGEWEAFRQRVQSILPAQRRRLDNAMRGQRRWNGDFFRQYLLPHPVLGPLLRATVWGVFKGKDLLTSFRLTHGSAVDIAGSPLELTAETEIGIVHPTMLPLEERLVWGDVLQEFDTPPAFAQLAREPYVLAPEQAEQTLVEEFTNQSIPLNRLYAAVRHHGWQKQEFYTIQIFKGFPLSRQFACIRFEQPGNAFDEPPKADAKVTLLECYFLKVTFKTMTKSPNYKNRISLGEVDAIVYDEMMRVLRDDVSL